MSDETKGLLEKHTQTVIMFVILGLVGWVGLSIINLQNQQQKLMVQYENILTQITDLKSNFRNSYSRSEALNDGKVLLDKSNNNRQQLLKLQERVRDLEIQIYRTGREK